MTWMGYEECRDRALHMRTFGGLTPEETALGCTISEVLPNMRKILSFVDLTFQWEQEITLDFGGWRLYYGTNEGGPYTQFGTDLVYDGTPQPTYTATETLAAPDNAETVFYFVATAYDNLGNESVYSNEVSYTADFLAPSVPVNLRVTVSTP